MERSGHILMNQLDQYTTDCTGVGRERKGGSVRKGKVGQGEKGGLDIYILVY